MEFKSYKEMVDKFLWNDSSEIFGNFGLENGSYIISEFVREAQISVDLLVVGHGAVYFTEDVLMCLEFAGCRINKENAIRVIVIGNDNHNVFVDTMKNINKTCDKNVMELICAKYNGKDGLNNFLVVDKKMYRLERPIMPEDKNYTVKAEVCCNGKEKARGLVEFFDLSLNKLKKH